MNKTKFLVTAVVLFSAVPTLAQTRETKNLAKTLPDKVKQLAKLWDQADAQFARDHQSGLPKWPPRCLVWVRPDRAERQRSTV